MIQGNLHLASEPRVDCDCVCGFVAFCLGLRFALEALRFVLKDLAFCLRRSCVLSSEDLTFCLQKILRFVFKDLAFCLRSTAFCLLPRSCVLSQKHCVLSSKIAFCFGRTAPDGDALRKCILSGPYKPTTVLVQAVAATDDSLAIPEHTTVETPMNMSPENKAHFQAEKEAIHMTVATLTLLEDMFKYLVMRIGMRCLTPAELEVLAKESA
nr:hypothetical protein [Tanacetum cinerariifolium]